MIMASDLYSKLFTVGGSTDVFPGELPPCSVSVENEIGYVWYKVLQNCKFVALFPHFSRLFSWASDPFLGGDKSYRKRNHSVSIWYSEFIAQELSAHTSNIRMDEAYFAPEFLTNFILYTVL